MLIKQSRRRITTRLQNFAQEGSSQRVQEYALDQTYWQSTIFSHSDRNANRKQRPSEEQNKLPRSKQVNHQNKLGKKHQIIQYQQQKIKQILEYLKHRQNRKNKINHIYVDEIHFSLHCKCSLYFFHLSHFYPYSLFLDIFYPLTFSSSDFIVILDYLLFVFVLQAFRDTNIHLVSRARYLFLNAYLYYNLSFFDKQIISSMSFTSNPMSLGPQTGKRRLQDLKRKLSMQIQIILDETKKETEQFHKQGTAKGKVYRDLHQVQCMKDVKSQNGFFHEYELGKKIGQGCHSTVYKCSSKQEKKTYAVKMTKQKDLELFSLIREGYRILKKLEHESIIQPKNLFVNQKFMTCYMVLQYCQWQELRTYMSPNKLIPKQEVSVILTEILKTINYMHNSGVCHRDIKPDNILYDPVKKKIKLIDFDIARIKKFTNSQLEMMTKTGCVSYRAPEIFCSIYDEQVDIWSVGIIAYQLLVGYRPFQSQFQQDEIRKICNQEPDYSQLSLWEQDLLQKLLCKDPKKRPVPTQVLSSPFFFVHTKVADSPPTSKTMMKSPSAGKQQFERSMRGGWDTPNKFYDDDVTDMFLGNNQGDIGVIHCVGEDEDENYD